ncbi:MAG: hypothetical protein H6737_05650 [Alphaproteobacteria bacterium]|nr:hypothetical protein [Alphaproteobacteria bacterium]
MLTMLTAVALAQQPWQVGPSPSASTAEKGFAFAAYGSVLGEPWGGRVQAVFAPHKRLWFSGDVASGSGFRTCPECGDTAFTGTGRVLAIDSTLVKVAGWGSAVASPAGQQLAAGFAAELDIGRFALDTSWPLWISDDPWDSVLATPELGARWHWSKRNATRFAVVGLNPELALTHRLDLGLIGFDVTARTLDRQPVIEAGVRLQL